MVQFSEKTVKGFQSLLKLACQHNPKRTLIDLLIQWRSVENLNKTSLEVIHYGSYLVESRPGLGRMPITGLFFTI